MNNTTQLTTYKQWHYDYFNIFFNDMGEITYYKCKIIIAGTCP